MYDTCCVYAGVHCGWRALREWQQRIDSSWPVALSTSAVAQIGFFFWLDCCCSTGASSIFIKHCSLKLSATFCCVMILFPGGNSLHTPHFFSLFICLSPSLPLCLLSCFLLFFVTIQLSLWQSLFSFPSFFHHSSALSPSIHPPYCLTGRVCCFYPSDIGSLPRACPETNEFSLIAPLGPAPSSASVFPCEITVHPAHTQALVGTHTHTHP